MPKSPASRLGFFSQLTFVLNAVAILKLSDRKKTISISVPYASLDILVFSSLHSQEEPFLQASLEPYGRAKTQSGNCSLSS